MDLIYADENLNDIGVLQGYTLDLAYGVDENNFVVEMALKELDIREGYYIYIDGTEYGGIVDAIGVDTDAEKITISGRTWTGILASKVILTDEEKKYYTVDGDANIIISDLLSRCDLKDVFDVEYEDEEIIESGIDIDNFQFRYDNLYFGLLAMLQSVDSKLMFKFSNGKVILSAQLAMNYATAEDFDSSIVNFKIDKKYNHVNHLVCLGSGELNERNVIHLFTDKNGGLQPYLWNTNKEPIKDSDYIDTLDSQVLFGLDEITEVYDYPSAETIENYELLTTKPADWNKNYSSYYEKNEQNEIEQIARVIKDVYTLTTSQPSNWGSTYKNYYTRTWEDGEWKYNEVEGEETVTPVVVSTQPSNWSKRYSQFYYKDGNEYNSIEAVPKYTKLSKQPSDWKKKYSDYYVTDGISWSSVSGITKYKYVVQTVKPSDWGSKWKTDYYAPLQVGKNVTYVLLQSHPYYTRLSKAPTWKKNTFYTQDSYSVAPKFKSFGSVYKKTMVAPKFSDRTVYTLTTTYGKRWVANTFYSKAEDQDVGLAFQANSYYRKVEDHFASLVEGGIERLKELSNADTLDITLMETENEYNIGDIIGATEQITKISTAQVIKKKIVNIERGVLTVRHEV